MKSLKGNTLFRVMGLMHKRLVPYLLWLAAGAVGYTVLFRIALAHALQGVINAALNGEAALVGNQVMITLASFGIGVLVQMITGYGVDKCVRETIADVKQTAMSHLLRLTVSRFSQTHSGDMLSRLTTDIDTTKQLYAQQSSSVMLALSQSVFALITIYSMEKRIAMLVLVLGIITIIINAWFARSIRKLADRIQLHKAKLMELLIDILSAVPIMKVFGIERVISDRYTAENDALTRTTVAFSHVETSAMWVDNTSLELKRFGILALGLMMVIHGELDVGTVAAVIFLQHEASDFFSEISGYITGIQTSLAGGRRLFEFLSFSTENRPQVLTEPLSIAGDDATVCFETVNFQYDQGREALAGLTLQIKDDQTVALVGPSGGGKSTIAKLIMGFYQRSGGGIRVNGRDIDSYDPDELRERIAYVPQEPHLFCATVSENIRIGRPGASVDEVYRAARLAQADQFIAQLTDGYHTLIGEGGVSLSGGQRQRICLARALIKNAPLLILDESFSALDLQSETQIIKALGARACGQTTIVITHRMAAVTNADMIYVIEEGQVAEQGTHEALMVRNGPYHWLNQ